MYLYPEYADGLGWNGFDFIKRAGETVYAKVVKPVLTTTGVLPRGAPTGGYPTEAPLNFAEVFRQAKDAAAREFGRQVAPTIARSPLAEQIEAERKKELLKTGMPIAALAIGAVLLVGALGARR